MTTPDLVFGKYEIQHRLAIGGMGEVFYAMQKGVPGFERAAILKSLLPELAQQEGFIDQFLDEARVAATLNHPNVVSIYEVGMWNGTYFIAMEYIRGRNLSQLIRRALENQQRVPPMVAARIVRDSALGLDHAHRAVDTSGRPLNIIHRDISPQNIMVRDDGVTKVVDFGIASASNRSTKTKTGSLKGKIAYMAPEQLLTTKGITAKVDQYALGVVFWEMLTGRRLFKADTQDASAELQVIKKVLEEPIPAPSTLAPDITPEVDAIVMSMINRDPAQRYENCAAAAQAIERVVQQNTPSGGESPVTAFMRRLGTEDLVVKVKTNPGASQNFVISLKPQGPPGAPGDATGQLDRPPPPPDETPKSKAPMIAGAVLLVAALAVGGYFATKTDPPPPVEPPVIHVDAGTPKPPEPVDAGPPVAAVKPATLKIRTTPAGATLRLDGRPIGVSPQEVANLDPAIHYLQVEKAGYKLQDLQVTLGDGEVKDMEVPLEKIKPVDPILKPPKTDDPPPVPGFFTINSDPPSRIFIDDQRAGDTPLYKFVCVPGPRRLKLTLSSGPKAGEAHTEKLNCVAGETIRKTYNYQ